MKTGVPSYEENEWNLILILISTGGNEWRNFIIQLWYAYEQK